MSTAVGVLGQQPGVVLGPLATTVTAPKTLAATLDGKIYLTSERALPVVH